MANIFDVAQYILEKKGSVTTMKLQKLCYYSQAWFLAWYENPLFDEDFEAWANGPVCRELFSKHRGQFIVSRASHLGNPNNLTKKQREAIDTVLKEYGDKDPAWLSELTHKERPWKETRQGIDDGASCDKIIDKVLIQEYYSGLIG